jgi:hypothetical protein
MGGMTPVPICPAVVAQVFMGHCDPAVRAELGVLRLHARRYFRHVWDKIGAKPHRIARARLAGLGATLSGGTAYSDCTNSNQQ